MLVGQVFPWSVVGEEEVGRLEDDFTDLSGLEDEEDFLSDFLSDFLLDFFSDFFFFSYGPLKPEAPEVPWPSTTPTTDTSAGSMRVGLRVSESLAGVDVLASLLFFLELIRGGGELSLLIRS